MLAPTTGESYTEKKGGSYRLLRKLCQKCFERKQTLKQNI